MSVEPAAVPVTDSAADRVRVEFDDRPAGGVAVVWLDRPGKRNGLDLAMLRGLVAAAARVRADRSVRAVVLRGAGPAFCAGLDFAAMGGESRWDLARASLKLPGAKTNLFQRACWAWRELPVPVIAVLHGFCFGGGLQLALAADFRFSTPDCELSVMEGRWGLVPDMSGTVTLRELVGMDLAARLTMTAEVFDGRQAHAWGLVSEVADDPAAAAEPLLGQLLARSPDAIAAGKRLLHDTWSRSPRWAMALETWQQATLLRGANHRIARQAALARETPTFRDRATR